MPSLFAFLDSSSCIPQNRLGAIAANVMFSAPVRDCREKVMAGQGLQMLNVRWLMITKKTMAGLVFVGS